LLLIFLFVFGEGFGKGLILFVEGCELGVFLLEEGLFLLEGDMVLFVDVVDVDGVRGVGLGEEELVFKVVDFLLEVLFVSFDIDEDFTLFFVFEEMVFELILELIDIAFQLFDRIIFIF
jgi:hypothetical protein